MRDRDAGKEGGRKVKKVSEQKVHAGHKNSFLPLTSMNLMNLHPPAATKFTPSLTGIPGSALSGPPCWSDHATGPLW